MRHKKNTTGQEDFGKKLGQAIAVKRKALDLTQDDLAGMVGVDAETISRFERGTTAPSIERLVVIARALGIGVGELLSSASPLVNDRAEQLVRTFLALDKPDQKLLLDFALLLEKR